MSGVNINPIKVLFMGSAAKQNNRTRPLSPHLSIYKPQITSVLSISHRLTGVALYIGVLVLVWWMVMKIYGCDCITPLFHTTVGQLLLGAWSFALFYHLCNGIRHLFWDVGRGFNMSSVRASGVAVILSAIALTALSWALALQLISL